MSELTLFLYGNHLLKSEKEGAVDTNRLSKISKI